MREANRLDSKAPELADQFRQSSVGARRHAVLFACEYLVEVLRMERSEIDEALAILREKRPYDGSVHAHLVATAATLDDEYFRIDAENEQLNDPVLRQETLRMFSKARAMSAFAEATSEDDRQLHEAIYEAVVAVEDPAELLRGLGKILATRH